MKIYELLDSLEKWTTGKMAATIKGKRAFSKDDDAVCWCLMGAISKCYPDKYEEVSRMLYGRLDSIAEFNDTHTYQEVIALVKELDI